MFFGVWYRNKYIISLIEYDEMIPNVRQIKKYWKAGSAIILNITSLDNMTTQRIITSLFSQ